MPPRSERYEIDGVRARARESSAFPWLNLLLALTCLALGLLILSPFPEKIRGKLGISTPPKPMVVKTPSREPRVVVREKIIEKEIRVKPPYFQVPQNANIARTAKEFTYRSSVKEKAGGLTSRERKRDGSYEASFTLNLTRPRAAQSLEEISSVNAQLPEILPWLPKLLGKAKVSPFFDTLYQNKRDRLQSRAEKLDELLTRHNYFDCQTMLAMEHPVTKRKVFLIQGDMDVVADGSDGDRLPAMPESITRSTHYQPTTSYGWKKTGTTENPMILGLRHRIGNAKRELGVWATSASRKAWLRERIKMLERTIADLQHRSYLIAEYDPFVVIPVHMLADRLDPFCPNVGDYCCVIYKNKIYPAIVGDGGPTFKIGEGSLRLAKEINKLASPYQRPVSDVSVTYLVFPRSAKEPFSAPDYADWRSRCSQLLEEVGGLGDGYELHIWEDKLPQ